MWDRKYEKLKLIGFGLASVVIFNGDTTIYGTSLYTLLLCEDDNSLS